MTRGLVSTVSTVSTIIVIIYAVGAGRWAAIATTLNYLKALTSNQKYAFPRDAPIF